MDLGRTVYTSRHAAQGRLDEVEAATSARLRSLSALEWLRRIQNDEEIHKAGRVDLTDWSRYFMSVRLHLSGEDKCDEDYWPPERAAINAARRDAQPAVAQAEPVDAGQDQGEPVAAG